MRRLALLMSLVLVAAACATATQASADGASITTSTTSTVSVAGPDDEDAESAQDDVPPPVSKPDGPTAPEFSMILASGETFTLSQETKPVYMIFWAEW